MRESFVFHEDYICDLPADYKADFIRYTVEYGLYGQKPKIADGTLEMALWAKIARRIDAETERYQAISAKRREAANKRYTKAKPPAAKIANAEKVNLLIFIVVGIFTNNLQSYKFLMIY